MFLKNLNNLLYFKGKKMKKLIYIASPYTAGNQEENVLRQIKAANKIIDAGHIPIWPLSSHYLHLEQPRPYDDWLDIDIELLSSCDALVRLPGNSNGADIEVNAAAGNMHVFYGMKSLTDNINDLL